jgi:N-methylhydantoinase A
VWPIIREYERTATATIHGYVQPVVARYLAALQGGPEAGRRCRRAMVTKSNGGVMTAELGKSACLQMLLSARPPASSAPASWRGRPGLDKS